MCGIVGYVGKKESVPVLIEGLRKLEYRGYDSAGLCVVENGNLQTRKAVGKIEELARLLETQPASGSLGISHTRWATHGEVSLANAHPHFDASGKLALVHNGVIENHHELRAELIALGETFHSQTDTEVLAHLIGHNLHKSSAPVSVEQLVEALRQSLRRVIGTFGIGLLHRDLPGVLFGARRGSPLVLGVGGGENYLASDVAAIIRHTKDVVYLGDNEIAVLHADRFDISTVCGSGVRYEIQSVDLREQDISKGAYAHYMLKEIHEQPRSVRDAIRGRISFDEASAKFGGLNMTNAELRDVERIVLTGCGTAMHAAMVGEYLIEGLAHIPTEVEFASELRYRNLPMTRGTLVFVISQSGETADTLGALRECKRKGHRTLGICNNVASTIARESDGGIYMHAGPEIGVAATKSFTSQVMIMNLLALLFGRMRHLSAPEGTQLLRELESLPEKIERVLELENEIARIATRFAGSENFLFLGRQANYPVALEGALKLKEISYLPASGHPSAELKHGVIALINEKTPTIFVAPGDSVFEKNLSNMEEVRARKGPVFAIVSEGCANASKVADEVLTLPECSEFVAPVLFSVPLQLFAYHVAVQLGCDVDKPRNLAKSVTVE